MNKKKVLNILYTIFIKYQLLFFILIFIDQLTKRIAINNLDEPVVIFSWLRLEVQINSGVAFSFLKNAPQYVSASVSVIATLAIEYYLLIKKGKDKIFNALLVCLAAGALGNGIDRWLAVFSDKTGYTGVIDFIYVTWFANFNVADIYVTLCCIGIVAYLIFAPDDTELSFKEKRELKKKQQQEREEAIKAISERENNEEPIDDSYVSAPVEVIDDEPESSKEEENNGQ